MQLITLSLIFFLCECQHLQPPALRLLRDTAHPTKSAALRVGMHGTKEAWCGDAMPASATDG